MSKRLLSLRGVPAAEADALREALDTAGVDYYELPATAFGISAGSIWVRDDGDHARARAVFDDFQQAWAQAARDEARPESFSAYFTRNPGKVIGYAVAAAAVLLLMSWPVFQLWS